MPIYKQRAVLEIVCGIKAFLNLEVGLTRGAVLDRESLNRTLERAKQQLDAKNQQTVDLQAKQAQAGQQLAAKDRQIAGLRANLAQKATNEDDSRIKPGNIIWIFSASRSGSTWLVTMLGELKDYTVWLEPSIGELFGNFYYIRKPHRRGKHYVMGGRKATWLKPLRSFILDVASAKFPGVMEKGYLAVKEPGSAVGAPLIMEALPESRMIFLVRDPRDVAASALDASRKGSWFYERRSAKMAERAKDSTQAFAPTEKDPETKLKENTNNYRLQVSKAREAYEAHEGPKVLVKYEDLRIDTLETMRRICSTLDIPVDEGELARVVEKNSWESIPEEDKGQGKFYRKATPEGWREDLSPEQVALVETITGPLIDEFYPNSRVGKSYGADEPYGGD